jgi:hypothetical protein
MTPDSVLTMRAFFLMVPLVLSLTACLDTQLPVRERIGLVDVRAFSNGGTPVVRARAVFYRIAGLQIFPAVPQECGLYGYRPPVTADNAGQTITAGPQVSFTVGAVTENAVPTPLATFPIYNFSAGTFLNFAAGDSVLVTIPGAPNGFEAMAIKTRLAEPFTANPLPAWVPNEPMVLTWQPAPAPGSVMVVSLRYNSTPGSTQPDLEIACAFPDTGSGTIPLSLANGWGEAEPGTTEFAFIRVRERVVEVDDLTRARVRSIFEFPLRSLADAP